MCVQMGLHAGGEREVDEGGGREVSVRDMGTRWNCALFVGLCTYRRKMNSNKIRHRCALLAQTSFVHNLGGGLVMWS